jgi:DPCD protein family
MSFENWLFLVNTAEKTSIKRASSHKFHYKWVSGREMVEEYNLETGMLTHRRWKKDSLLKNGTLEWDIEVGEASRVEQDGEPEVLLKVENEPVLTKRITRHNIEWRIKNLR